MARSVCEASSNEGLTPSTTPISTRKAIGVKESTCAIQMPVRPYSQRPGSMPNRLASSSVTTPARPNSSISASPITNGGVMIGSTVSRRSPFLNGSGVRVAASAKARPSSVEPLAVINARVRVRQAVPQLPPFRQPRLQMAGSCILAIRPSGLNEPSTSCTEETNMLRTG
ncbi:hypothetical protein D3C78_1293900 [compost metagenome]